MSYVCPNQMEVFSQLRISDFGQLQLCDVGQLVLLKKEIEKGITPIIALLEDVEVDFV